MAKTVLSDEEKLYMRAVILEIKEIRKVLDHLAEAAVNLSDKEFLKAFNPTEEVTLKESELERHEGKLEKQIYHAKRQFKF